MSVCKPAADDKSKANCGGHVASALVWKNAPEFMSSLKKKFNFCFVLSLIFFTYDLMELEMGVIEQLLDFGSDLNDLLVDDETVKWMIVLFFALWYLIWQIPSVMFVASPGQI